VDTGLTVDVTVEVIDPPTSDELKSVIAVEISPSAQTAPTETHVTEVAPGTSADSSAGPPRAQGRLEEASNPVDSMTSDPPGLTSAGSPSVQVPAALPLDVTDAYLEAVPARQHVAEAPEARLEPQSRNGVGQALPSVDPPRGIARIVAADDWPIWMGVSTLLSLVMAAAYILALKRG
jgi:hypothetical protein